MWPGVSLKLEFFEDPETGRLLSECGRWYLDLDEADAVAAWFPTFLKHHKGVHADLPFELLPWQIDLVVIALFGVKSVETGRRRFRKLFLFVPKKNGKTPFAAALALYLLGFDGEPGSGVYIAAASEEQARIAFNDYAKPMVQKSPLLSRVYEPLRSAITMESTFSTLQVISSKEGTKHGFNIHGLVVDELHAHKTGELFNTLHQGTAARAQPLTIIITTAGKDQETICGEEYDYAKSVLSGDFDDPTVLPVIFEADPQDDWTDPVTWAKANPSLGETVQLEQMESYCRAAMNDPRKLATFQQLHLNIWTAGDAAWIDPRAWTACAGEIRPEDLTDLVCAGGLDLSSKEDLTSFALVFRRPDEGEEEPLEVEIIDETDEEREGDPIPRTLNINFSLDLLTWSWLPEDTLQRRVHDDRVPYDVWRREGCLHVTEGSMIDYDTVLDQVVREAKRHGARQVGIDPWNAGMPAQELARRGVTIVEVPQSYRHLSEATKVFGAMVRAGRVRHDGSPLVRWCASNMAIRSDANGNERPVKSNPKKRIDPIVAAIIALSRLLTFAEHESVYERRGLIWL